MNGRPWCRLGVHWRGTKGLGGAGGPGWHIFCRQGKTVLAVGKHVLGVASGETAGLGSEIKEDSIQFPLAQGSDGCLINTGYEQGGCAPRAEAVGLDPVRGDVGNVLDSGSGGSQFMCDFGGGDVADLVLAVVIGIVESQEGLPGCEGGHDAGQHGWG